MMAFVMFETLSFDESRRLAGMLLSVGPFRLHDLQMPMPVRACK